MIFIAELTAAIDAAGTLQTFYHSTRGYSTRPTDTPADTYISGRLLNPGNISRGMFSSSRVTGAVDAGYGEIVLQNKDGALDAYKNYGFDGQVFVLRAGEHGAAYPSGYTEVMRLKMRDVVVTLDAVRIRVRDRIEDLKTPLCANLYAGTGGTDGISARAGQRRPRAYGKPKWVAPTLVDNSLLLYQWTDNGMPVNPPSGEAVFDQGVALTVGSDYTTLSDLTNAAMPPSPGQVRFYRAGGYFRCGSVPTYLTLNSASSVSGSLGTVLKQIALDVGIASGDISSADVSAVNAASGPDVGWANTAWVTGVSDVTALDAMEQCAATRGCWFGFDRAGVLRMGQLVAPSGSPVYTFTQSQIKRMERGTATDVRVPVYSVTLRHSRNWSASGSVANSLSAEAKQERQQDYKTLLVTDASIRSKHAWAETLTRDIPSDWAENMTAITAEANRILALFGADRDLLTVEVPFTLDLLPVDLGAVVQVTHSRIGYGAGHLFTVVGVRLDLSTLRAEYTLWG